MRTQGIRITLQEDCVFSAGMATEGGHEGLDRIPGQALLGVAAARLYRELSTEEAYTVFHSGRVRFGDGLPAPDGTPAVPVPLAWHHPKEDDPEDGDGRLIGERLFNFCRGDTGQRQPAQLRGGYVRADGLRVRPQRELRLKTAIDPQQGRAEEGRLFGYDALLRGQTFQARLDADYDVNPDLFRRVTDALSGERLLGRSRSAEYGRARLEPVEPPPLMHGPADQHLTLWLLADLALVDDHGQPTLDPEPRYMGLGPGTVDYHRTFLRSRRYAPWNAYRQGYDREREVLVAGSVVTVELEETPGPEALKRLASGVGLYREGGLGRIWANPTLLQGLQPSFEDQVPAAKAAPPARPGHPLIGWLQSTVAGPRAQLDQAARELAEEIAKRIESGSRAAGIAPGQPFGPSRSQWGTVLETARQRPDYLHDRLFRKPGTPVQPNKEGWRIELPPAQAGCGWTTLAQWLEEELRPKRLAARLGGELQNRDYADLIARLAHYARERTVTETTDKEGA